MERVLARVDLVLVLVVPLDERLCAGHVLRELISLNLLLHVRHPSRQVALVRQEFVQPASELVSVFVTNSLSTKTIQSTRIKRKEKEERNRGIVKNTTCL